MRNWHTNHPGLRRYLDIKIDCGSGHPALKEEGGEMFVLLKKK
jgi:hypothetical protein